LILKLPVAEVPFMKYVPVFAALGVLNGIVAPLSVQYVYVRPGAEPAVIEEFVISAKSGEQTGAGLVIIRTGGVSFEIIIPADDGDMQPEEFVTVKVYTPPSRPEIV
jgi:hypothetical protein